MTGSSTFSGHIALGTSTGEVVVLTAGFQHTATLDLDGSPLTDVAVAGGVLFALSADGSATWWDVSTGEQLGHKRGVFANACIALPDNRFATVGPELRLWSESEVAVVPTPRPLTTLAVSADGMLIAAGSPTGPLAVYDLPTRQWVTVPIAAVAALHYATDRFLACTTDGRLREVPADTLF
ncbi:hypothetical protein [Actinokineospora globicatena]|uniref:hypothetical protein n=1 Tax=Actinokineospora globicatena TaxID=103729 RepID=UPI0025554E68|nr:hypothetical protein [Actinokineospora globicatena]